MLAAVTLGGVWIGSAVVARHAAQAAADLAAMAAANRVPAGPGVACSSARVLAAAMGAALTGCAIERLDVVLTVRVDSGTRFGGSAFATARAGPVVRGFPR